VTLRRLCAPVDCCELACFAEEGKARSCATVSASTGYAGRHHIERNLEHFNIAGVVCHYRAAAAPRCDIAACFQQLAHRGVGAGKGVNAWALFNPSRWTLLAATSGGGVAAGAKRRQEEGRGGWRGIYHLKHHYSICGVDISENVTSPLCGFHSMAIPVSKSSNCYADAARHARAVSFERVSVVTRSRLSLCASQLSTMRAGRQHRRLERPSTSVNIINHQALPSPNPVKRTARTQAISLQSTGRTWKTRARWSRAPPLLRSLPSTTSIARYHYAIAAIQTLFRRVLSRWLHWLHITPARRL